MNLLVDFEVRSLVSLIGVIDQQLEQISRWGKQEKDPDGSGLIDEYESLCGLGFVAGQRFITSICGALGIKKSEALRFGPFLKNGVSLAAAVNDAANYWKHKEEWPEDQSKMKPEALRTKRAVEALGIQPNEDYVLCAVLAVLTPEPEHRLGELVAPLSQWGRNAEASVTQKTGKTGA